MGFESKVIEAIESDLGDYGIASFSFGTLFVENVTEKQVFAIKKTIVNTFNKSLDINRIGQTSEYAIDFI